MKNTFQQISLLSMFLVSLFSSILLVILGIGIASIFNIDNDLVAKSLGILGLYAAPLIMIYRALHKNNLDMKMWLKPTRLHIMETISSTIFPEVLGVGTLLLATTIIAAFSPLPPDESLNTAGIGTAFWVQLFIYSCLLAPFCEEIIFRGFLFEKLQYKYSIKKAVLITSIVFGIMHGITGISPAIVSIVLCVLYKKYNSLVPGMVIHFLHNLLVFLLRFFVISATPTTIESTTNVASSFNPLETLPPALVLTSGGIIWLVHFLKKNWKYTAPEPELETNLNSI
ncbi:type II CAAX endopeptidase family protein [Anaerotignum sp.]|uniref:type II CAAX endopeptidase family protein n=1 Tax=Anaerotignum sp. TaxID=2039241 RepID=UPI0028AE77CD|nr:type II CAAX endopeptidase family protein [Anaerotignum sp.]